MNAPPAVREPRVHGALSRRVRRMPWVHPVEAGPALLRDGYLFISRHSRELQSDVFLTRLMLRPTICLTGEEATELFYDVSKFERTNAAPIRVKHTLFGRGAIQGTDGAVHHSRKRMFLSVLTARGQIARLAELTAAEFDAGVPRWELMRRVELFPAVREVLLHAVCTWAGVPLAPEELPARANDIAAVIDGTGGFGLRHWRARVARKRADAWMQRVIEQERSGKIVAPASSALSVVSRHRDPGGRQLDSRTAGAELFNIIRPTVAIDRFITFAALALHSFPRCRAGLLAGDIEPLHFVQEVRRYYPFFPFVVARVKTDFEWRGHRFRRGRRALLDIYGTDHDPRIWEDPDAFRPERFRDWSGSAFKFIPQGGGDPLTGHRCPGELVTIELMKGAVEFLTRRISYRVAPQELGVSLQRMPALPGSGFVIENVRRARSA
jgi:fatty-acid peroxygenase